MDFSFAIDGSAFVALVVVVSVVLVMREVIYLRSLHAEEAAFDTYERFGEEDRRLVDIEDRIESLEDRFEDLNDEQ